MIIELTTEEITEIINALYECYTEGIGGEKTSTLLQKFQELELEK